MSENSACPLCSGTVVVTEKSTDALPAANGTTGTLRLRRIDQFVAKSLVVAFAMVMRHEIGERPPKMAFSERDDAIEAFFFDRADEAFRVCIAVRRTGRCPNHADARR